MIGERDLDPALATCLRTLAPYLDQLVIAGGWAPYLYSKMREDASRPDPLITRDLDAVVPPRGFSDKLPKLDETILAAGFEHVFTSLDNPPVVKYRQPGGGAEIEFITDAPGDEEGPVEVGSVNAQRLHFVGLLLDAPWAAEVALGPGGGTLAVRVPNPAAFLLHKTLVAPRRRAEEKRAKDLYYMFYVLDSFPEWAGEIESGTEEYVARRPAWARRAARIMSSHFGDVDSRGMDLVVSQRPQTAFPDMDDDVFRRYAFHVMSGYAKLLR